MKNLSSDINRTVLIITQLGIVQDYHKDFIALAYHVWGDLISYFRLFVSGLKPYTRRDVRPHLYSSCGFFSKTIERQIFCWTET